MIDFYNFFNISAAAAPAGEITIPDSLSYSYCFEKCVVEQKEKTEISTSQNFLHAGNLASIYRSNSSQLKRLFKISHTQLHTY
jgi:hypothetical protein